MWAQKAPLTTREREIASPIAPQAVDREVAGRLFVSLYRRGHLYRADITLNWIAEGAKKAGLEFRDDRPFPVLTPEHVTGPIHKVGWIWALALYRTRPIPPGARVHDSVRARMQQQPKYARGRIPSDVEWADPDWLTVG